MTVSSLNLSSSIFEERFYQKCYFRVKIVYYDFSCLALFYLDVQCVCAQRLNQQTENKQNSARNKIDWESARMVNSFLMVQFVRRVCFCILFVLWQKSQLKVFSIKATEHIKLIYLCVHVCECVRLSNIWRHEWPQWLKHGCHRIALWRFLRDTTLLHYSNRSFNSNTIHITHPYEHGTAHNTWPINFKTLSILYTHGNFTILTLIFRHFMPK